MERLNPKTDLVFKLLLQRDADFRLLRSMLECILKLSSPIKTLELLNPDVEPDYPSDKPIARDVRAYLDNLVRIDIEMQAQVVTTTASRFLYYWARDFGQGLKKAMNTKESPR
jgi:predicted transposase/invertase (TIGR01784 family)